jgi:hypothetical protein
MTLTRRRGTSEMCIAIFNPAKAPDLTLDVLRECQSNNPDGMGLMWSDGRTLHVHRYVTDLKKLWKAYRRARSMGVDVALHFRIGTSGEKGLYNCHPFEFADGALMHNGVLFTPPDGDRRCDTRVFVDEVIKRLPNDWLESWYLRDVVEEYLDGYSKLIVMLNTGEYHIFNEKLGVKEDGNWFSNSSYKRWAYSAHPWMDDSPTEWWNDKKWDNASQSYSDGRTRYKWRREMGWVAEEDVDDAEWESEAPNAETAKQELPKGADTQSPFRLHVTPLHEVEKDVAWVAWMVDEEVVCQDCMEDDDWWVDQVLNIWDDGMEIWCNRCSTLQNVWTKDSKATQGNRVTPCHKCNGYGWIWGVTSMEEGESKVWKQQCEACVVERGATATQCSLLQAKLLPRTTPAQLAKLDEEMAAEAEYAG